MGLCGKIAISGLGLVLSSTAYGQEQCHKVLDSGTYSVSDVRRDYHLRRLMFQKVARSNYEEVMDRKSFGFDVPGYFNGRYSPERHEAVKATLQSEKLDTLDERDRSSYYIAKPDSNVINAWSSCIGATHGISARFVVYSATDAVLELRYNRQTRRAGVPVVAKIESDVLTSITPLANADCLKKGYLLDEGNGCDIRFVMPDYKTSITLTIESDQGNTRVHLPPRIAYDVESTNFPEKHLEALVQTVEHTGIVNSSVSFTSKLYMPDELRTAGYVFDPSSFGLVKAERLGDGRCLTSVATPDGPHRITVDSRIDINPRDRPAKCRYHWRADLLKVVTVAAGY